MRQSSVRTSQLSLPPHYLQEVPPLFTNDFQRGVKQPYSDFNCKLFANDYLKCTNTEMAFSV